MLVCYYLAATLMISDGVQATPVSSAHSWAVRHDLYGTYVVAENFRGNYIYFKIDDTDKGIDDILLSCDSQAKQKQQ